MVRHLPLSLRSALALGALATLGLSPAALSSQTAAPGTAAAAAPPEEFRMWIEARAGTGTPVHWVSEGGIYEYPSGRKLFGMIGFDSSRVFWPGKPGDPVVHLTRKTYAYTDPETGEILTEYNGRKVEPIAYPYQMITYRYENGRIYGDVEQGVGAQVQKIKATQGMTWRWMGRDTLAITAPVFLDFPLPNGTRYEAWENYDFFIHRKGTNAEPYQMAWQRYGALPPFAGKGQAIYHLLSWRATATPSFPKSCANGPRARSRCGSIRPGTSPRSAPSRKARRWRAGRADASDGGKRRELLYDPDQRHPPGELTNLRPASICPDNFRGAAHGQGSAPALHRAHPPRDDAARDP